jgi:hypothetical protein
VLLGLLGILELQAGAGAAAGTVSGVCGAGTRRRRACVRACVRERAGLRAARGARYLNAAIAAL